jgi:hypothetical protein
MFRYSCKYILAQICAAEPVAVGVLVATVAVGVLWKPGKRGVATCW